MASHSDVVWEVLDAAIFVALPYKPLYDKLSSKLLLLSGG